VILGGAARAGSHPEAARRYATAALRKLRSAGRALAGSAPASGAGPSSEAAPAGPRPAEASLAGCIDEPQPEAVIAGPGLEIRGWSVWCGRPALAVAARINGRLVAGSHVGSEDRPDVARTFDDELLAKAGWRIDVPPDELESGPAEIAVSVWVDPGRPPVELDPVAVLIADRSGVPHLDETEESWTSHIEDPALGVEVDRSYFRVEGWAVHHPEPVDRIEVRLNGFPLGRARLGIPRPDVVAVLRDRAAMFSGFEMTIDASRAPVDGARAVLQLVGYAGDRAPRTLAEHPVALAAPGAGHMGADRAAVLAARSEKLRSGRPAPAAGQPQLVVFTHTLTLGGGQLWLQELLEKSGAGRELPARMISFGDGPLRDDIERMGIPVHVTSPVPVDDPETYEARILELMHLLVDGGPTVALVNTMVCAPGADACRRLDIPVVWAIHESLSPGAFFPAAYGTAADPHIRSSCLDSLGAADALVFEAEATRALYELVAGAGRTAVIRYGIDTAAIGRYGEEMPVEAARAKLGLPVDRKVVLVMGTVEPRKSQTSIARAFARLTDRFPNWMLVFVGANGSPYCRALESFVEDQGLAGRVRIEPVTRDTYTWYRSADLLLSSSDLESLPRSALESMCFGVPVLSTSVFGVPELIDDGRNGFLFEANDARACLSALERVFQMDPAELAAVGESARGHVMANYDSTGYAREIAALLRAYSAGDRRTADVMRAAQVERPE
jgi:glycosyltransferase involved in cell wall biosynthesis